MAALLALALVGVWGLALTAWPDLPERIPTRFDMQGRAIAWGEPAFGTWFVLPTLATAVAGGLGLALPSWIVALARRNSSMLNMPQRAKFRALPEEARVRVAGAMASGLQRLSLLLALVFLFVLYGTNEVAHGRWQVLPSAVMFALVGVAIGQALWLVVATSRAVRRESETAEPR